MHNTLSDSELHHLNQMAHERFDNTIKRHCLNCKNLIKIKTDKKILKKHTNSHFKATVNISKNVKNKDNSRLADGITAEKMGIINEEKNSNEHELEKVKGNDRESPEKEHELEYEKNYNSNSFVTYYTLHIVKSGNHNNKTLQFSGNANNEADIYESNKPHIICDLCIDSVNSEIIHMMRLRSQKRKKESFKTVELKCLICLKQHSIEYKNFRKFIKTGFRRCCDIL